MLDRGFIFGDGVYEVVPVYGGQPVPLRRTHGAARALAGASCRSATRIPHAQWRAIAMRLIDARRPAVRSAACSCVYIQVTRGVALRDHAMPQGLTPTVFVMVNPHEAGARRGARQGRGLRERARLPLAEGAHQEHQPAGRGACAADQRRGRRGGDHHVPRRLAERSLVEQCLGREGRHRAAARPRTTWCWQASATA